MALAFLALGAVGHMVLWVALINRVHAIGIKRHWIDLMTVAFLAALVFAPLAIAWALYDQPPTQSLDARLAASPLSRCYVVFCTFVCIGSVLERRQRWRDPEQSEILLSDRTMHVELPAASASYVAPGRFNLIARLPLNQVLKVRLQEKELAIPRLAVALDGLRIAHLTDLHMSGRIKPAFFEHIVERLNAASPDIVAVTGDIVEGDQFLDWIPQTLGRFRARHGVYYILGNHDRRATEGRVKAALADAGLIHVGGRCQQIVINDTPILVAGNELPWYKPAAILPICPPQTSGSRPFRLLLSHSPDQFRWAEKNDVDLMLAGHLHGGQVRFPLLGAITSPSIQGVRYVCGVFRSGNTVLHVSRGVGSLTPVRVNCPPEVAMLTLRSMGQIR